MTTVTTRRGESDVVPPVRDLERLLDFTRFLDQHATAEAMLLGPDGDQIPVPLEVYGVLRQVVHAMSEGQALQIMPLDKTLTTQQAADFLGVSRTTLVKLLGAGEIPFDIPTQRRHRRLRLGDVMAYRDRARAERRARLAELTRQAAEDGFYDEGHDIDAAAAASAVKAVRAARKPEQ